MGEALIAAAAEAGIRITLLDTAYLSAGFGAAAQPAPAALLRRHRRRLGRTLLPLLKDTRSRPDRRGHPLRTRRARRPAGDRRRAGPRSGGPRSMCTCPSRRRRTTPASAAHGRTPTRLLADHGVLGPRTTGVHNTHLTDEDIALLGGSATGTCMCPTTERDLADGIGPAVALQRAGSPLSLGSDSHAVIDLLEEARAMELNERLRTRTRGHWTAAALLRAASADGHAALGWPDAGAWSRARSPTSRRSRWTRSEQRDRCPGSAPRRPYSPRPPPTCATRSWQAGTSSATGAHALVAGRARSPRGGRRQPCAADAAPAARPRDPVRTHSENSPHDARPPSSPTSPAWSPTTPPSATDPPRPDPGRGRRHRRRPRRRGPVNQAKHPPLTTRVDAGGRAVIPGFVDSHSHLVFAGDRTQEFNARMSGPRLHARAASAPPSPPPAPPPTTELERQPRPLPRRGAAPGHHHLRDQVRLRPDRRGRGPRPAHRRRATPTRSPTSAPTSSPPTTPTTRPATSTWSPARCWTPAPRTPVGSTSSARRAPSTATRPARSSPRAGPRACTPASTPTSSSYGPGVQLAVELDAACADHCTHLTDADVDALAPAATPSPRCCPAPSSPPAPHWPDARRLLDAGATVALSTDCNPGSSFTSSMPFCIALAVRDMGMTPDEAVWSATAGGARGPAPHGHRPASPRAPAPTWSSSTPPATSTSPTGRASRWSRAVWRQRAYATV